MLELRTFLPLLGRNIFYKFRFSQPQKVVENAYGKVDLPSPPKRPLTSFLLFCKENRHTLTKEKPLTAPEQTKLLAEKWSNLSPDLRKAYEDNARKDTIIYGQLHKQYYENLTEQQREELSRMKAEKRESRKQNRIKKALRESGIPKLPKSAYGMFLQSQAKETKDFASLSEFSKEIALKWQEMPEEDRKPYIHSAKENKESYVIQMREWREKLTRNGDVELLKAYDEGKYRGKKKIELSNSKSSTTKE